jgi:signal transduction histidine kinase/DNA-binding response OmpR family regulator
MEMDGMRRFKEQRCRKDGMVVRVLLLVLLLPAGWGVYGTETRNPGYKYFKNYSYFDYDHHAQNFCITQDRHGIIYVGNRGGVLIFDGVSWELIKVPNTIVRSLTIAGDGRIYVGGKDEIGYLEPDGNGFLEYMSLTKHLDGNLKDFSYVWNTIVVKEGVYFRTSKALMRWNYEKIDMYETGKIRSLFSCHGEIWAQKSQTGLLKIKNGTFMPLPGDSLLEKEKIWIMLPYNSGAGPRRYLLGTRANGFFIYDSGRLTPFVTEADDYLKENKISCGIRLSSGEFAVATLYGGLVIFDLQGRVKYMFDKKGGLQDNNVKHVFEDNRGNLWLSLSKGISRLEYQSPFFHYDDRCGLDGIALTVTRHNGDMYAGTTQGIYFMRPGDGVFSAIPGSGPCWELLSTGRSLLTAAADGLYEVKKKGRISRKILETGTYRMAVSRLFPGFTWCATGKGLVAIAREDNRWIKKYSYKQIATDIRDTAEDPAGKLWVVTAAGDILKLEFPRGIENPVVTDLKIDKGLFGREIYLATAEGHVVFVTGNGLFCFDEKNNRFTADTLLGKIYSGGPGAKPVFRMVQDENRYIWFHSESKNYRAIPVSGQDMKIEDKLFRRIPLIQMNAIYPEPGGKNVWFAGLEGLIRLDCTIKTDWKKEFPALIRRVSVNETDTIFGGYETGGGLTPPVLPFRDRNISFRCAAPFFEKESAAVFRYILEGYNDNWSAWTSESRKHYTNLNAGKYTFRVQARNIYGDTGQKSAFSFKVLPPWHQTWWAYTLYGIGFLLLFYLIVKWRSHKLVREKERLEQIVKKRTREVRDKNDQLQQQTTQLQEQSEKLKEMDKVKSRFFTNISHEFRTPLTLVMSPLEQLLSRSRDTMKKRTYRIMLRNLHLLLTLINQLLELSRIESGKMKLLATYRDIIPLLKGVAASFCIPAEQKQLTLQLQCPDDAILLYFDNDKVEEVLYNLLGNAIKFTPAGGKVSLSAAIEQVPVFPEDASSLPAHVMISIKDTGPGIPENQICNIFERFFQADNNNMEIGKGTGIGLTLAKEIILLHNGQIDVRSAAGEGTEFILRLPTDKEQKVPGEISSGTTDAGATGRNRQKEIEIMYAQDEEEPDSVPQETGAGSTGDESGEEGRAGEAGKTMILVVEDNADMRRHIRESLAADYRVIEAADGKEGIAKAIEFIPDLIISDIMMPEVDGYELCRRLKKDIRTSHIPIIMLTARASAESVMRGLGTGADDYVTKPFNTKILGVRIKNLIELRRQLQLKIQRQKMLLPADVSVSSQDDLFLQEFQRIIEKNLDNEDLDIDYLCDKLIIGRATLFRKIQALTGEPPNQFIQSYRLERGAQLLRQNYGNVTEVAFAVGFSSSQYFAACFKEKFHQSPKAFQVAEIAT